MANFHRLIIYGVLAIAACWSLLAPLKAHAAIPASQGNEYRHSTNPWSSDYLTVCKQINSVYTAGRLDSHASPTSAFLGCLSPCCGWSTQAVQRRINYTCPANSTLVGTECTCNSGYTESGGSCIDPAAAACEALAGQSSYLTFNAAVSPGGSACGDTGCLATVGSPVIRARTPGGAWVSEADAVFTGATCTPSPSAPAAEPDPCPNGQAGTVNGTPVCIPYSSGDEVERESETTTETTSGGDTTSSTSTSTTTCTGNSCTTTTTTNTSVNGGTPTTTTTEQTEPRDDYCQSNPRAPQCLTSSFGGACASGFTCEGDAIQCAQARKLHELACALDQESPESALYAAESNATAGPADIPSQDVNVGPGAFDASNALGTAACVADLPITVMGQTITLPISDICPALAWMRLILLAVGWLMAYRIVARE